jgi:hypothetical protein
MKEKISYLKQIINKMEKGTYTKSDLIATIKVLIDDFEYVPDFITE